MRVTPQLPPAAATEEAPWWPRAAVRRRRAASASFLLCIADHDTGRFSIEGPMSDAEPWISEVIAARRAGRDISCCVLSGTADDVALSWAHDHGGTCWPPGSIVKPETLLGPSG
jgi:hypothetical protein